MIKKLLEMIKPAVPAPRYTGVVVLCKDLKSVLCVLKVRPESCAGKLNAIGGVIIPGEGIYEAGARALKEMSGIKIDKHDLDLIGNLADASYAWDAACFAIALDINILKSAQSKTDEKIMLLPLSTLLDDPITDIDYRHLVFEALRLKSKQQLYNGSRKIHFTRVTSS
jgi:hypothetical protein